MENLKRTRTCGDLTGKDAGKEVILNGWVHRHRDHGGIYFIDLRDRYGITQIVIEPDSPKELLNLVSEIGFEYCIAVRGIVRPRPEGMKNPNMATGEIEVKVTEAGLLSTCEVLPFMIEDESQAKEEMRLKYRFLDLRSAGMQKRIKLRHDVCFAAREYLVSQGFYEIETPTLIRSTPEGARDFLVPSRVIAGKFYALPQSPQLYKQLLMAGGMDKYFQIARCYRDEDARGDRQPEFTQIDLEMSFVSREDIFAVIEGMMKHIFRKAANMDLAIPFRRLAYDDAMNLYGSDKPDLRFGLQLQDFSPMADAGSFQVFKTVLENKGLIKALVATGCGGYSRKQITDLEEVAKTYGAKGLAWMKVTDAGKLEGGISKFFEAATSEILGHTGAKPGDLLLFVADKPKTACTALGAVRSRLGADLGLAKQGEFNFCWIIDFPLFEYNEEGKKWDAAHHMFSMPQEKYIDTMEKDPGSVKGDLYDLVCNGVELASGSIRIHDPKLQARIFSIVGYSMEEAQRKFGFLLEAFKYGPPPHGGVAPGLDRLVTLLAGVSTIREVIAFPKNTMGASPMDDCPSEVDEKQLSDLHLKIFEK
ncbi:MAG: aspartate--tRNA ligase [Spirochaetaceae bacterium]|nr:MAG: aspartate--tRNA ligase [Spirochaetaceae bacterium]